MTSKVTLKLAEELLDRFFREAEGQANRKLDLAFLLEDLRTSFDRAEPALEYLHSRGLIAPYTGEAAYLTDRGVAAIAQEQDIKAMPKYQPEWKGVSQTGGGQSDAPVAAPPPAVVTGAGHLPRPWRPTVTFVDPEGQVHRNELGWMAVIGRSDEASLKIPDPRASKKHVELKYAGDRYVLRDLGSANGTMVNGNYVDVHPLRHGDVILVGRTELQYTCPEVIAEPPGEPEPEMQRASAPVAQSTIKPAQRPAPLPPMPVEASGFGSAGRVQSTPVRREPSGPMMPPVRHDAPVAPSRQHEQATVPSMRSEPPVAMPQRAADAPVRIVKGQPESAPRSLRPEDDDLFGKPLDMDDAQITARPGPAKDLFAQPLDLDAPSEVDLFDEDTPRRGVLGPEGSSPEARDDRDLFAPKEDRGGELFAPDYSRGGRSESLFDDAAPENLFDQGPGERAPVSPLPLGAQARGPSDLLPAEPEHQTQPGAQPLARPEDDEPFESTIAMSNPLFAPPVSEPLVDDPLGEEQTSYDGVAMAEAAREARSSSESPSTELPAWGVTAPEPSHPPFSRRGSIEELMPSLESRPSAAPHQILAASADLPEAPALLEDPSLQMGAITGEPVPYPQFAETLLILRMRIADAGLPDPTRILDAIDLLRKHPSVRAALTEPRGD